MKKKEILNLGVFIVLVSMLISVLYIVNPFHSSSVSIIKENIFKPEIIEYSNNFKINSLTIKNCDFYYNLLNNNEKKIYSKLAQTIKNMGKEVIIENKNLNFSVDSITKVVDYFIHDHPEVFYLNNNYEIKRVVFFNKIYTIIDLNYTYDSLSSVNSVLEKINFEINNVLDKIKYKDKYEKELYIHDYLANKINYYYNNENDNNNYHNIDRAFNENLALCDGFSKAFQVFLDKCNIDSLLVTGKLEGKGHAWNLVKLNGKWYNVDLTSDKITKKNKEDYLTHLYFNLSSKKLEDGIHVFDNRELYNLANNMDENFYIKSDSHIYEYEDFEKKLKKIVKSQENNKILEFSTDYSDDVPKRIISALYNIDHDGYSNNGNGAKLNYYNKNNIYIVFKNK